MGKNNTNKEIKPNESNKSESTASRVDNALNEIFLGEAESDNMDLVQGNQADVIESEDVELREIELDTDDDDSLQLLDDSVPEELNDSATFNEIDLGDGVEEEQVAEAEAESLEINDAVLEDEVSEEDNEDDLFAEDSSADDLLMDDLSSEVDDGILGDFDEDDLDFDASIILESGDSLLEELREDNLNSNIKDAIVEDEADNVIQLHNELEGEDSIELTDDNSGELDLGYQDLPDSDVEFNSEIEDDNPQYLNTGTDPSFEFTTAKKIQESELTRSKKIEMSDDAKKKLKEIDEMMTNKDDEDHSIAVETADLSLNINESVELPQETKQVAKAESEPAPSSVVANVSQDYKDIKEHYQFELHKLAETVRALREDRDQLERTLLGFDDKKSSEKREMDSLQAELEERNIEFELLESKYTRLFDDLKTQVEILNDKKAI